MNVSPELEKLVRQLLALGVAVIIVITAPGGADGASTDGSAQTIVLTPTGKPRPTSGVPVPSRFPRPSSTASPSPDAGGGGSSAAEAFGWGEPNRVDEFESGSPGEAWKIYDGPGHDGKGTRSPSAVSLVDGIMRITGDSSGTTAGMAWNPGQKYGRWEARVKSPASDPSYHSLLLLWPDAEDWPSGGELDFMEISDSARQLVDLFLHYGADNSQVSGQVNIDATEWHTWALEWTPDHIAAFVDGKEWHRTTDSQVQPPGPMHLCIQLDWFPEGDNPQTSTMEIDWVRQYPVDGSSAAGDTGGTNPSSEPRSQR